MVLPVYAHPGKTDENGCHVCKTNCDNYGLEYGEYHCHDGESEKVSKSENENENKNDNSLLISTLIIISLLSVPAYRLYNFHIEKKLNVKINDFTKHNIYKLQGKKNPYTKKYMNTFYQCRMYIEEYYNRHNKFPDI